MASTLYSANHKQWNHTGFIFPEVEHSESMRPSAELKPASWLPVVRYDTKMEDWIVVMPGKVIACDRLGRAVPAGMKVAFEVAAGSTALTYTANDYTAGTIDLTTGVAYAVNGTTTYTQTQLTAALQARGLIRSTEYAQSFVSPPIGYAPYAFVQWCGGDGWNPAQFTQHNYNRQHQTACGCDYVLSLPMVPEVETTETQGGGAAIADTAITFGTGAWKSSAGIAATTRYASLVAANQDVVAMVLGKYPVAKITVNTPIVDSASTLASMTEVSSIADVMAGGSGYFYIDYEAGVLFLYEPAGNAIPSGFSAANTITYYQYEDTDAGAANIAMVLGDVHPGDFLTFDALSNYVPLSVDVGTSPNPGSGGVYTADPDYAAADDDAISAQLEQMVLEAVTRTVAQVVAVWEWPRDALNKVRTQYSGLTATERMPGSATAGMTDSLNLSGGSSKVAIVNFMSR